MQKKWPNCNSHCLHISLNIILLPRKTTKKGQTKESPGDKYANFPRDVANAFSSSKEALKIFEKLKTKNIKTIGVQSEGALIATNVYWAMFKKSLENEKWPKGQMMRMIFFLNFPSQIIAQTLFWGPKWHLLSLGKQQKTTI